jgi:SAM-dependent methyltransferase
MMMGTREAFEYFECSGCGSLNRADADLGDESRFYPPNYYSFTIRERSPLRRLMSVKRDQHLLGHKTFIGSMMATRWPEPVATLYGQIGLRKSQRILDVGCGSGALLRRLAAAGFSHLHGADPFIDEEISERGFKIEKKTIEQVAGEFDIIMFNHSFEHVQNPEATLRAAKRLLWRSGICIIRIPTCSSLAWARYGVDWVQIDAPRHTLIPSRRGIDALAKSARLSLGHTIDDSDRLQFAGSELYKRGLALNGHRFDEHFSRDELIEFDRRAADLNSRQMGDQAAFVLSH